MNIHMITSVPMIPPWDQGDKNLAYTLTTALPQYRFRVLTAQNKPVPTGHNLTPEPVYRSRHPSLVEKASVYWRLLSRPASRAAGPGATPAPDLYHLVYQPYPLSSRFSRWLPEFQRRPTLHTVPATANGHPLIRNLFFADRVVTLSEHGRQTLQELGLQNVVYIPPGINVALWQALQRRSDLLKARLGLGRRPVVLFPGHYGPKQGADVMLGALPRLVAEVPRLCVVLACRPRSPGDKERERTFRRAVEDMGLAQHVRFYDVVADMQTLIGASDIVVLPLQTMHDKIDIPTTLLESMAAGKAIVISNLPPMSELIVGTKGHASSSGEAGLAVPPGDPEALASAATELLTDRRLRELMAQRGQALVQARFDIAQVARQYAQLYQEMAQ